MKGKITRIERLSKKFHNVFRFTRRTAHVTLHNGKQYSFVRHVLETGPAVSVLPYFYSPKTKDWHVVLVEQYRPAVDAVCLEAPGGLTTEGTDLKREMARELKEESGIHVDHKKIKLVGKHHLASSFCDQVVHLGVVEISHATISKLLKESKHNGLISENEFTEVVAVPLHRALNQKNLITYTLARYQVLDLAHRLGVELKEI